MKKEFAFNIFFLLLINLLIKPFYIFGIESKVQQAVGDASFGLYFSLFGLVFLHQFINDPGIQNYNSIFVAQNREKIGHHFPRLLGMKILLLLVMLLSVFISSLILGYKYDVIVLLFEIVLVLFMSGLYVLMRSLLSSLGYYKIDTWFSGLDRLLLVIVLGLLLWLNITFTIHHFVFIQVLVYFTCVVSVSVLYKIKGISLLPTFDLPYAKQFLNSCLPYAVIIFLTAIIMRADGVIIERILEDGKLQAGIYAKGYRFLDAANMFGYLFGALLLPMYANKIDHKKEINELFHLAYNMLLYLSLYIGFLFYAYRQQIFALIYGDIDDETIKVLLPLVLTIIPVAMTNIFGPLIIAAHKVKVYNKLYLAAVFFYLILNVVFVPIYGIYAAALTAFATWTLILIGMVAICYHFDLLIFNKKILIDSMKLIGLISVSFMCIKELLELSWWLEGTIIGLISFGLALVLKVIPTKFNF